MSCDVPTLLRAIPSMEELLTQAPIAEFAPLLGRELVKRFVKETIDDYRQEILNANSASNAGNAPTSLVERAC